MKSKALVLIVLSLLVKMTFAQLPTKQWDVRFGGSLEDQLRSIKHTPDGGYILGGYSKSPIGGDKTQSKVGSFDYWIIKTDSNGNKQWDKVYGGSETDDLVALEVTSDGGFILGGYSESGISGDKTQASQGEYDYWIVKTDANGNKQWDKTFGGLKNEYLTTIHQTNDGGYILGGYAVSNMNGDVTQQSRGAEDYWIVKTDSNGEKQWDARFGGNEDDDLQSLVQTSDGGYLLAGTSSSGANGDKTQDSNGITDYWVVKTDANGIKQWDKTYGGDNQDYCNAVTLTTDGGFLLGGYSFSGITGDKSQVLRGVVDCWVVKIDETGAKEWDKSFGGIGADVLTSLLQTADGGYLLAGSSASPISGEKSQEARSDLSGTYDDYWCLKMDGNGIYQWDRRFGGGSWDDCYAVVENPDHSISLGGSSFSQADGDKSQNSRGDLDYWLVKSTPAGNVNDMYVGNIQPLTFMQGNKFQIPFVVNGSFSPGNIFYAILSDNSGAFTTADTVGLKNSTTSGIISVTIPPNIPNGENYHVRVVASDTSAISPANEQEITVGPYSTKLYDNVYGGTSGEVFYDMIQTTDGGFLYGGVSTSPISGDVSQTNRGVIDYWIIKTDSNGTKQWDARFGGSDDDELQSVKQTSDGGFILGGYSKSGIGGDKAQGSQGSYDYWIVKTNANGVKQWDRTFGGNNLDYLYSVLQTSDKGYLLTGRSQSDKTGDKSQPSKGNSDYWVIKTDSNGIKQWDRTYGGSDWDTPYDVVAVSDGYLLAGNTISPISGDQTNTPRGGDDFWLVKINKNGVKQWDRRYGGSDDEELRTIIKTFDGGYVLSGNSASPVSGEVSQPPFCLGFNCIDYWIIKTDSAGNKQWDQKFGGTDMESEATVIQTPDSGYLIAGNSNSGIGGVKTQNYRSYDGDYWVVRINSQNEILWDTRFGGLGIDYLKDAIQVSDGSFILGGNSGSSVAGGDKSQPNHCECVSNDFWIVKVTDAVFANSIVTSKISPILYSSGDTLNVHFTASGNFLPGNIFTAQLSNALGNFSSPTSIGSLSSSQSGLITSTIPPGTPYGTQYRIRVVSSAPSMVGTDNGENITINPPLCQIPLDEYTNGIKPTSAKINWDVIPNAQSYSIRYRKTGTGPWTKVTAPTNSKKLKGLSPNTEYDWIVKSVCDQSNNVSSDWCATQNFTTLPARLGDEEMMTSFEVYPNPFSSFTTISFSLEEDSHVSIELIDLAGRKMKTMFDENVELGNHEVQLNREQLGAGIYFLKLKTGDETSMMKIIVE